MEKINFTNGTTPALNATNLNKLQDNVEDAINDLETEQNAKIKTTKTTSNTDTYSCNYINSFDIHSTSETKTSKTWIDGKTIYRSVFEKTISNSTSETLGEISNIDMIWVSELSNTIIETSNAKYYVPCCAYESGSNFSKFYIQKNVSNVASIRWAGNSTSGKIIAVVEYTKTTD